MAFQNPGQRPVVVVEAPAHPVPQLQGPFEESMFESASGQVEEVDLPLDAPSRRNLLLDAPSYQRIIAGRWKQKPGEKYHPLWKVVAQMSFGIHLLAGSMARSEEDVFQILQTHVDEIDIFLERTTEDFNLAQDDIQERLRCLKLPLQHPEVFDRMLEEASFRGSIVEGNEKIEHIVNRTGCAMKDALKDIQKGFDSITALERYLFDLQSKWVRKTPEHEAVFVAMLGNVEGWRRAFMELHMQGNKLGGALRKLTEVINQVQQRAGEVSRRLIRRQQRRGHGSAASSGITVFPHQNGTSRSSSRNQTTPSPAPTTGSVKPLPGNPLASGARQHSRSSSREHAPRPGTNLSYRPETSQSVRSTDSRRSQTPDSRAASRNANPAAPRDNGQTRMNIGTPRLVHVNKHAPYHKAESIAASVRQTHDADTPTSVSTRDDLSAIESTQPEVSGLGIINTASQQSLRESAAQHDITGMNSGGSAATLDMAEVRKRMTRNLVPIELPADVPTSAFLAAPMSSTNRLSTGLGMLPSERRALAGTSKYNPTTALIELLSDPSRLSKLPVASNSPAAPESPSAAFFALEGRPAPQAPVSQATATATKSGSDKSTTATESIRGDTNESAPTTPAKATRTSATAAHDRAVDDKIPLHTRSPKPDHPSLPVDSSTATVTKPPQPKLNVSTVDTKTAKSRGDDTASATVPSELSAGYEEELRSLTKQKAAEASMLIDTPETASEGSKKRKDRKKLSFIAELEGSLPVLLPATVYTPLSTTASTISSAAELEAPRTYFNLPPRPASHQPKTPHVVEPSGADDQVVEASPAVPRPTEGENTDEGDVDRIQFQLEEAIRSSIATAENVPLPDTPIEASRADDTSQVKTPVASTPQERQLSSSIDTDTAPGETASCDAKAEEPGTDAVPDADDDDNNHDNDDDDDDPGNDVLDMLDDYSTSEPTDVKDDGSPTDTDRPITAIMSPVDTTTVTEAMPAEEATASTEDKKPTGPGHKEDVSSSGSPSSDSSLALPIQGHSPLLRPVNSRVMSSVPEDSPAAADTTTATTMTAREVNLRVISSQSTPALTSSTSPSTVNLISPLSIDTDQRSKHGSENGVNQWRAFFSGPRKSPKSPSGSMNSRASSIRSNKLSSSATVTSVKAAVVEIESRARLSDPQDHNGAGGKEDAVHSPEIDV